MAEMLSLGIGQEENVEPYPQKALRFLGAFMDGIKFLSDGSVWFMIHEHYGCYQIGLYYDNLLTQAHGEDL